jgi:hypothetical protein
MDREYTTNTEQQLRRHDLYRDNMSPSKHNPPAVRRTVKYLSVCTCPHAYRAVTRAAPDGVIRTIANAALNVERGPIHLTASQKALFRKHRRAIAILSSPTASIKAKRRVVESQTGGFPFLPILLGSALAGLGSRLFGAPQ